MAPKPIDPMDGDDEVSRDLPTNWLLIRSRKQSRSTVAIVFTVLVLLAAGAAAAWWFLLR